MSFGAGHDDIRNKWYKMTDDVANMQFQIDFVDLSIDY